MAARIRDFDWAATPVGAQAQWPQSLRTLVTTLLECQLPMYVAWGPQLTQFYNDAYAPILGARHPDALGRSTPDTWPEIWPTIGPMWQQVLAGQAIGFDDFKLTIERFGYPEDCYFNFSYSPVRDETGKVMGVLVTFAETTQRVLSERRARFLDDLSQRTRLVGDPSEAMQVTAAALGEYLGANRCAYAHVHADQDTFDLIGDYNHEVPSIVGRYRFTDFGAEVTRLMRSGEAYVNENVDTHPVTAGTDLSAYRATRIAAVICVPLHKNGRFVAAMAVHQSVPRRWTREEVELVQTVVHRCWDSLERIRSDAELREQARQLEVLNRTGAALSAELDLSALLDRVTHAATELTGAKFGAFFYNGVDEQGEAYLLYTLAGAPPEAFEKFGHPRPTPMFGPTFRGEPPIRLDDVLADPRYGQWGPHHGMPPKHLPVRSYLAVPVISRSGEVIGGLFFGHPEPGVFTERSEFLAVGIASQAAIAVDNARLYAQAQRSAAERTQLLESERAARAEAERASSLKDEFLATLSHELRTPLSAINGWVHILRRKLPPEQAELAKGVDVIGRSTGILVQLIDDLLDMSRITSGKLRLDLRPQSAASFAQAAIDVIRPAAEAAKVSVVTDLDDSVTVLGDAGRLQQLVWNLLANAVKFTPPGGEVRVSLRRADGEVELVVADTGVGIDAEALPHIFDRFRQADGSITRKYGGLGLGLSIVRHLADLHGGSIRAESAGTGAGSRFILRLPLHDGLPATSGPLARMTAGAGADLQGIRIVAVDDERDSRELLLRVLEEAGATVHAAANAEEAIALARQVRPSILLSDIGMPGTDGYELLRRLRRMLAEEGWSLKAIALTAFARPEDRQRALDAGFVRHLTKPMDPAEIVAVVGEVHAQAVAAK
jgi:signal transduction histidine kinase/ActR/RegA family two-component response regulator